MPAHQAMARAALLPMGAPVSSPRSVSVMGVNGQTCTVVASAAKPAVMTRTPGARKFT